MTSYGWTFYIPRDSPRYSEGLSSREVIISDAGTGTAAAARISCQALLFSLVINSAHICLVGARGAAGFVTCHSLLFSLVLICQALVTLVTTGLVIFCSALLFSLVICQALVSLVTTGWVIFCSALLFSLVIIF